ncbi:MAG: cobalamin-dependent protein, partial [bacterium]
MAVTEAEVISQIATPPQGVHDAAPSNDGWTAPVAPQLQPMFRLDDPEPENRIGVGYVSLFNAYNLGIRYIHALTQSKGYPSPLVFFGKISANDVTEPIEVDFDNLFKVLKKDDCRLIAVSVSCSSYYDMAVEITRRIRTEMPEAKILWGGVHVTLCPEDCIKHADYVCLGEGETTTLELARCLSRGEEPDRIQSLWIKRANGSIQTNPMREVVRDLDDLPFPTWDDRDKHIVMRGQYKAEEIGKNDPYIITMTMRGCPFKCTYCINNRYHNDYREEGMGSLRARSPQNVIDELRKARDLMPNFSSKVIAFYDDVFSVQLDWITEFANLYCAEFTNRFWCYFHPNLIQQPIIEQLKRMGLTHIDVGIQTGSERIRREYY